jgi:dipeptidyl aminopeptidase/acylaminoacyl peptidase
LNERSVLRVASGIQSAVLILSGAKDARTDWRQAQKLAEQITNQGGEAKAIVFPDFGHIIPVEARNQQIDPFIDRVLTRGMK